VQCGKCTVAFEGGRWIAWRRDVLKSADDTRPGRDDFFKLERRDHIVDMIGHIDRAMRRLGGLRQQRPMTRRAVRRREIRQNGCAIEGHRIFRKVDPFPISERTRQFALDAKADHVNVRRKQSPRYRNQIVEPSQTDQTIDRDCRDQGVVAFPMPVIKLDAPGCRIDRRCGTTEIEMKGTDMLCHAPPYRACPALLRIAELGIGSPIPIVTFVEQIGEDAGEFRPRHPFRDPVYVHAFERVRPDLLIIREHEMRGDAFAKRADDPISEIGL
jgi:hypothetical protein